MKNILKLSALILFVFLAFSCTTEDSNAINQNKIKANDLKFVGIEHNRGLEETLIYLKTNKSELSKLNSDGGLKSIENFLISRIEKGTNYSKKSNEIGISETKKAFEALKNKKIVRKYSQRSNSNNVNNYLSRLEEIMQVSDVSVEIVIDNITNLENEIENSNLNLTEEDLITLFSATQTAKYTSEYWANNIQDWIELSNTQNTNRCGQEGCYTDVVGSIAGSDVAGAVGGAAGAWAVNIIPGLGQVAYGSAIVGGAVGTSVTDAVSQFLDWWNEE